MYSYIIGEVKVLKEEYIVIENNNIGYKIYMPHRDISTLSKDESLKVYTEFVVNENQILLYGFISSEELEMFLNLKTVSGIGPKAAISILSTLSVYEIEIAILGNDIDKIVKAPGIGKKSASRIILELSDKIDIEKISKPSHKTNNIINDDNYQIALQGLLGLGYSKQDSEFALRDLDMNGKSLSQIMKEALKRMS